MRIKCGHCSTSTSTVYHNNVAAVRACARQPLGRAIAMPEPVQQVRAQVAPKPRPNEWQSRVPRPMVENIKEGWYAVADKASRGDDFDHFTFFKVWRPTKGKRAGQLIIKTQHSEAYRDFITIYSNGSIWFAQSGDRLDQALLMVAADPITAAMNYSRLHNVCSRCHKKLTDERSRWYGIGPECEGYWPEVITVINETKGYFHR